MKFEKIILPVFVFTLVGLPLDFKQKIANTIKQVFKNIFRLNSKVYDET